MVDVVTRPLSVIIERLWQSWEVPEDWKKAIVTAAFKKGKKKYPGTYGMVSLT